eukprot:CAMPEP_0196592282 /NCGR_PEP_ID=MMETSP1081-20130531/72296_1 /TAXON_ID=36882 /ORGANISM="Pyramimonas amylifera, Strain CCMP720" /LENGTH=362 /DNA_ID=CAMNT_0041915913 /DNA_START=201 /DNA_END=1289 /DNA_ORIENTATION=-
MNFTQSFRKNSYKFNVQKRVGNPICEAVETNSFSLPQTAEQASQQASEAIKKGFEEGLTRQTVNILLPTDQRRKNYMFTEGLEYPENAASVYATAGAMAKYLFRGLGVKEEVVSQRIDDDGMDGEPVGVFTTDAQEILVIILPTADTLPRIRELEKKQNRKIVLLNPQWRTQGNIVSDFGIGPWKKRAEEFVAKFTPTYSLTEQRIGAAATLDPVTGDYMGLGGIVRLLQIYPGECQTFSLGQDGSSECIMFSKSIPSYQELEKILYSSKTSLKTTRSGGNLESEKDRLTRNETDNSETKDWSIKSTAEVAAAMQAGTITEADVLQMEKVPLRAALDAVGQPSSGKVEVLRNRLIESIKKFD